MSKTGSTEDLRKDKKRRYGEEIRNNKECKMFGSLCDDVLGIVKRWVPKSKYPRELGYRDELMKFIRSELKRGQRDILFGIPEEHSVQKEAGRARADIEIDRNIGIELKRNLKGKKGIGDLIGELDEYEREYNCTVVVLCGEMTEETVDELKYRLRQRYGGVGFGLGPQGPRVEIVRKDEAWIKRRKKTSSKKTQPPSSLWGFR